MLPLQIDNDREWIQWWIEGEEHNLWIDEWIRKNKLYVGSSVTVIERLWGSAMGDAEQRRVVDALESEMVVICTICGGESDLDRVSGCYTCKDCSHKVCGDG